MQQIGQLSNQSLFNETQPGDVQQLSSPTDDRSLAEKAKKNQKITQPKIDNAEEDLKEP